MIIVAGPEILSLEKLAHAIYRDVIAVKISKFHRYTYIDIMLKTSIVGTRYRNEKKKILGKESEDSDPLLNGLFYINTSHKSYFHLSISVHFCMFFVSICFRKVNMNFKIKPTSFFGL